VPAAIQPTVMSWRPVGPQKGGVFTNATYHDMAPDSTNFLRQCVVDHNTWRVRYNDIAYGSAPGASLCTTLEIFNQYSGVSQSLTSSVVGGFPTVGSPKVINVTTGNIIRSNSTAMPITGNGRWVFASVKNRFYMANGTDVPAISLGASTGDCIPWGFAGPVANMTYQINAGTNVLGGTQGTGTVSTNFTYTWASGPKFNYFQIGQPIYIQSVYNTVAGVTSNTIITLSISATNGAATYAYSPTGILGTAAYTNGSGNFTTWNGATLVAGSPSAPAAGNPVFIAGTAFTGSHFTPTIVYSLSSVATGTTGTIAPVFAGVTGTYDTEINMSNISFDNGRSYQYAYSYYNPTSGHVSNTSPILQITDGAPRNVNVSITLSNIVCTNDANYTKIILWRSAVNGANLFPLVVLNNDTGNAAGNTITYTDYLGDDTQLGTAAGGPGFVASPRGENSPPPVDLLYPTYWDGRFWGASATQVGILFFSGRSAGNNEDISVGVAEECWPLNFTRVIPESDGRITGLRAFSGVLAVLTDNNIYIVQSGTRDTYALSRISGKGHGTSHFLTTVIPSEDANGADVLVHFGNDGRLYFLMGGGGDYQISYPIQDQLGGPALVTCVGVQHTSTSSYVILSTIFQIFLYDLERKIWLQRTLPDGFGAGAYVEGLLGVVIAQMFGSANTVAAIYHAEQQIGPPTTMVVATNQVSPTGERKDDKQLESVVVYYPNRTDAMTVNLTIDAPIPFPSLGTSTLVEVPNTGQYAANFEMTDARVFVPQGNFAHGRLFQIVVSVTPSVFPGAAGFVPEVRGVWAGSQDAGAVGGML
jgi:hypothetical protein